MTSNRSLGGINQGAVGLDTTLFFTDTVGLTGQLIRAHGPVAGGKWAWFVRPSRDTATSHVHFNYSHRGDALGDNLNAIGFIRDDERRTMDGRFTKTFWPRSSALERIAYTSNYNIFWRSQENTLRSWRIDESIQVDFRNRWTARYVHQSEYKLFEKKFRNHANEIELGYNTREFQAFWVAYRSGRNFDSELDLVRGGVRRKLSDQLSLEYEFTRLWLDPDPQPSSTTIHVVRGTQNFTKDLFLKLFFQTSSLSD